MNHNKCKCNNCDSDLRYQISPNIALRVIGLKIYWCHKCDANTYIWPWSFPANELLRHNKESY